MAKTGVARITISLPPELLQDFDKVIEQMNFDRSKAIQQAMRDFITEYQWDYDVKAHAVGTITLIYDHEVRGLESKLTKIQHHNPGLIGSSIHIHLDDTHCLLVIVVNGEAGAIRELAKELKGLRGVKQLKLTHLMMHQTLGHKHTH
ncbi:MAG: nickel-responsive transcriptional regulator NikR [Promethearchaeota archaeon]